MMNIDEITAIHTGKGRRAERGVAMLLVLGCVVVATVLSLGYIASQQTTIGVTQNVNAHAEARAIAESALLLAIDEVNNNGNWRTEYTHGQWLADKSFNGASIQITGLDGEDIDEDGEIDGDDETDGDLADDATDKVTLTATATINGVSHTVHAVVTPAAGSLLDVLMVVEDDSTLSAEDTYHQGLFESWGWTVTVIDDGAAQGAVDTAVEANDVVYVSQGVSNASIDSRLKDQPIGIVLTERDFFDDFNLATGSSFASTTDIDVTDNTHAITNLLGSGVQTIGSVAQAMEFATAPFAPDAEVPAERTSSGDAAVLAVDTGGSLLNNDVARGRRVAMCTGVFDSTNTMTTDGRAMLREAIEWASSGATLADFVTGTAGGTAAAFEGTSALKVPVANSTPSGALGAGGLADISNDDADEHSVATSILGMYPKMRFTFQLTGDLSGVASIQAKLIGRNVNNMLGATDGVELHIWNDNSGAYELLEQSANTEAEVELTGGVSTDVSNYLVGGDTVILLAVSRGATGTLASNTLYTDYVNITVAGSNGDLIALYGFQTAENTPVLAGHWKLDDVAHGGQFVFDSTMGMKNSALVDSFDSTLGPYGGANISDDGTVATNSLGDDDIGLSNSAEINGNLLVGAGADPNDVVSDPSKVSGATGALDVPVVVPDNSAPVGMPVTLGSQSYNSNQTFSTDLTFGDLGFRNNADLRIDGNIRVHVTGDLSFENNFDMVFTPGSSVTFYIGGDVEMDNKGDMNLGGSPLNLNFIQYNPGTDFVMSNNMEVYARIQTEGDFEMSNSAQIMGSLAVKNGTVNLANSAGVHLDTSLPNDLGLPEYPFTAIDEQGGSDGNYQNGTLGGETGYGDGGTAAEFDGGDDYIEVPHISGYLANEVSISFWFKADILAGVQGLISKDSAGRDNGGQFTVYTSGSTLYAKLESTSADYTVSHGGLSTGTWYHVVVGMGYSGLRLYVNGVEQDTDSYDGGLGVTSGGTGNTEPIVIGADSSASGDNSATPVQNFFTGCIDDIRIYNMNLDATNASALYNKGAVVSQFDPSSVVDTSGYGAPLDLTIQEPAYTTWLSGGGLQIDTATQILSGVAAAKIDSALAATNEYTIELVFAPLNVATPTSPPSGIVSMSADTSNRNFTVGQNNATVVSRTRTNSTNNNGTGAGENSSGNALQADTQTQVFVTYDGAYVSIYEDGSLVGQGALSGDFSSWNASYQLILANELGGGRYFLGKLHRVAIYDRAFTAAEITGDVQGATVRWVEKK